MKVTDIALTILMVLAAPLTWAVCRPEIPETTPNSQLIDNGNGTITDTATGLMWKQCSEGQSGSDCSGNGSSLTWSEALRIPKSLNLSGGYAGFSDWRLPNIKELQSIVEVACFSPSINSARFPNTPVRGALFWSSSIGAGSESIAWSASFYFGDSGYDSRGNHGSGRVRLVRGGQ